MNNILLLFSLIGFLAFMPAHALSRVDEMNTKGPAVKQVKRHQNGLASTQSILFLAPVKKRSHNKISRDDYLLVQAVKKAMQSKKAHHRKRKVRRTRRKVTARKFKKNRPRASTYKPSKNIIKTEKRVIPAIVVKNIQPSIKVPFKRPFNQQTKSSSDNKWQTVDQSMPQLIKELSIQP